MELTLDNIWAILMENAKQIAAITEERKKEAEERKKEAEERKQRLAAEAEERKKEAEERKQRLAAEAEERKKAAEEHEKRLAAEAEGRRKAAEEHEKRLAAEAEERRKEAEGRRKAAEEHEKRLAAEAEERRKEAEERKKAAEEREKAREKDLQANNRMLKELGRKIAELGDVLGLYAEAQVRERIKHLFDKRGIHLDSVMYHYQQETKNGEFLYEIDILLVNSEYAVITEVKNQLKKDDVDEHIARMEKCTITPPKGAKDKILLGCIGAMIVSPEVETYAKRQGFYLLKPSGESVKMANPANFKHKEWHVIT